MGKLNGVSRDELLHYREHKGIVFGLNAGRPIVEGKAWENVDEFTEYAIALAEVARFIREEMP